MFPREKEQEIIQRILSGDTECYALIVKEYQEIVANLCFKLVGNSLDVEEVTQQVFVELYDSLPRFQHASKLSTFIYRITVNVVSKMIRHDRRVAPLEYEVYNSSLDYQHSREEQIMLEERQQRLYTAIGQLKHEQRTALVLYTFNNLSYSDIAEVMQVSLSKVESLIFRAKKNLKKMLT